jgi:hypothetical protein
LRLFRVAHEIQKKGVYLGKNKGVLKEILKGYISTDIQLLFFKYIYASVAELGQSSTANVTLLHCYMLHNGQGSGGGSVVFQRFFALF